MNDRFIIPPFSVFDTKQGYWQDRKNNWKQLGIKSEIGRDEGLTFNMGINYRENKDDDTYKTSIFDPVICEICYKWFNIKNGIILDPFAGGSVRGIVANVLDYKYIGIDLSDEQIKANIDNAKELKCSPTWYCDDSINVDKYVEDESVDMIFSCPPYFDLEVYSDKENDLSNMSYDQFKENYKLIIERCVRKLKNDRFSIFVVGDVRDKNGYYRNIADYTKQCFIESGMGFYNDIILLNSVGTASLRAGGQFEASRKLVKIHQNILCFYKGNIKNIKENFTI